MLVEIRSAGIGSQRPPFGARGRHEQDFGIAAFGFRCEDRGGGAIANWFAKNEVPVGEVQVNVVFAELNVVHSVASRRIEAGVANAAREFERVHGPIAQTSAQQDQKQPHSF